MNKKGQYFLIFFMIMFVIFLFVILAIILKNVGNYTNDNMQDINITNDPFFGENIPGSTREELEEKIKDHNIAPPELAG